MGRVAICGVKRKKEGEAANDSENVIINSPFQTRNGERERERERDVASSPAACAGGFCPLLLTAVGGGKTDIPF